MRDSRFRRFIESYQSRVSHLARVSRYASDTAAIVRRIVPIRLISLTCSPMWISTLYRPGGSMRSVEVGAGRAWGPRGEAYPRRVANEDARDEREDMMV